jgi:hypothetical protein
VVRQEVKCRYFTVAGDYGCFDSCGDVEIFEGLTGGAEKWVDLARASSSRIAGLGLAMADSKEAGQPRS